MTSVKTSQVAAWTLTQSRKRRVRLSARLDTPSRMMTAKGDPTPAVVASTRLVGAGASLAYQQDAAVQRAQASGSPEDVQQSIAWSPATGCVMALTLAMEASGYNPASPGAAGNAQGFAEYVAAVLECPLFSSRLSDVVSPSMSGDWSSVIDQIVGYYTGIDAADIAEIRNSLWALAQAASSTPFVRETEDLFVQTTLNAGSDLQVYLYRSTVQMTTTIQPGGKHSPDTVTNNASMQLDRDVLAFDSAGWPDYAPILIPQTTATLTSWLNDNTTPQGTVPVQWNG